jgi:AcrR family transcriptional regulator
MTSVWLRDGSARPRRGQPLTRERIVDAAVDILDGEDGGTEALTMRRLAQRLGVTATALYWHVDTKEDVLDLAVDHIFGDVPVPPETDDWRHDVRTLIGGWRAAMLRHPWAPGLIGRPMLGPNVRDRTEFLRAALVRGGHDGVRLAVTVRLLANVVIGSALTEATWRRAAGPTPTDPHWSDDELFDRGLDTILG